MTKEMLAAQLDGREIGEEISRAEAQIAKESGLVVVYGASDDLMEFDGAIRGEVDCYKGGTAYVVPHGLWESRCSNEGYPYAKQEMKACEPIKALWCSDVEPKMAWRYETRIPHATFNVYERGELYCVGIVFEQAALNGGY